jgi:hypothetical protein
MLLKTNGEKMSVYRPLAMLMKKHELKSLSRDVDEKKGRKALDVRSRRFDGTGGHRGRI